MNYWLLSICMLFCSSLYPSSPWNFTLALQGSNDFIRFSSLDAEDILTLRGTESPFILIQIEKPQDNELWRYQLAPSGLELISLETALHPENTFSNLLTWSINNFPANYNAFALWGAENPLPLKTWNTNLKKVYESTHKKLDLFSCNGSITSSIEAAFECAPYCSLLLASELKEVNDDYAYAPLFAKIARTFPTPCELARSMIALYAELYPPEKNSLNTQTALDLSHVPLFSADLDAFTRSATTFLKKGTKAKRAFSAAYAASQKTDDPNYIDFISFLTALHTYVSSHFNTQPYDKEFVQRVSKLITSTRKMIIAHTGYMHKKSDLKGLCIYCPQKSFDASYRECTFAKSTRWLIFLHEAFGIITH